jgi:predicted DNA-binding protein
MRSTQASSQPRRPASADAPFYATGRPLQTSIAIDPDCATRLEQLARDTGISTNALTVAAVHAGLPASDDHARAMIVDERVGRAGLRTARIERNLRLPQHLRARLDELTDAARDRLPRATRADLVNAALRTGLPSTSEQAAELAISHARRVEQAATA